MNLKPHHCAIVALAIFACSCASTSLQRTWKSPDFQGRPFKKLAVITADERPMVRELLEGQLATQLEARGQPALRGHELMTIAEIKAGKDRAAERLRQAGADAVVIQRLVNRTPTGGGDSRAGEPPVPSFSSGSLGWFDYYCVVIPSPTVPSADLNQDFYIETALYDLSSEKRVWSCMTATKVAEDADRLKLVKPLSVTIATAMAKDGVIR